MDGFERKPDFVHGGYREKKYFRIENNDNDNDNTALSICSADSACGSDHEPSPCDDDDVDSQLASEEVGVDFHEQSAEPESEDEMDLDALQEDEDEILYEQDLTSWFEGSAPLEQFQSSSLTTEQLLDKENHEWAVENFRETAVSLMGSFGLEVYPINQELVEREEYVYSGRLLYATEYDLKESFAVPEGSLVVPSKFLVGFDDMEE